jgi:hypothetical protein
MKSINFKNTLLGSILLASALTVSACGQSLLNDTVTKGLTGNTSSSTGGTGKVDPWAGVETSASSSNTFGQQSFTIDTNTNMLKLYFELPVNIFGGSMQVDIPEIPGAFVAIQTNSSGNWELSFNIPLSYLVKGLTIVGPTTLPNGDALPGVPGGEPPRIAAHIVKNNLNLYLYGSVKYFALYVPTPGFNPYLDLVFPIKNSDKTKILGYFATVSAKGSFDGGLFMSIVFPPELQRALDNIFN